MEPPAKRLKLDFSDIIQISVRKKVAVIWQAQDEQIFHVPRNLITSRSRYWQKTCAKCPEKREFRYGFEDSAVFSTYVQLLYSDHIVLDEGDDEVNRNHQWQQLVRLYLFARKLRDAESSNSIMDRLAKELESTGLPSAQDLIYIFDSVSDKSEAQEVRQLLVHYAVDRAPLPRLLDLNRNDRLRRSFGEDIMSELVRKRDAENGEPRAPIDASKWYVDYEESIEEFIEEFI